MSRMNKMIKVVPHFSVLVYTAIRLYIQDKKPSTVNKSTLTLVSAGVVQIAMESVVVYSAVLSTVCL